MDNEIKKDVAESISISSTRCFLCGYKLDVNGDCTNPNCPNYGGE